MDSILKKEEMAFYFNQAQLNIMGLDEVIEKQQKQVESPKAEVKNKALDTILEKSDVLKKLENYIFNSHDVAQDAKKEIKCLMSKLIELRHFYSHYVHNDTVKVLRKGEKPILEKYYQNAIEATGSETVKLEIINNKILTEAGVLFLLCMFLKKSQANKLISSVSGFKRNDVTGQPRRNLFTYYSQRDRYKIVSDMQKHFLLFQLVNHLVNQDGHIEKLHESEEIGKGHFFHRMASKFLNVSEIMTDMKFYSYESKKLKEQRGDFKQEESCFTWIEPFQGNSYFSIKGHKGVIGEEQLKELCYALLVDNVNSDKVKNLIIQFLSNFENAGNEQAVKADKVLDRKHFPANYFSKQAMGSIKEKVLSRLDNKANYRPKETGRAYEKMKEVLEFINNSLPADDKLKLKNYRLYLKMVRFWGREKGNIKREFDNKGWSKHFPSSIWQMTNLEAIYNFAKKENARFLRELKIKVNDIDEREFEKYQQINDAQGMEDLKGLSQKFNVVWQEKDWVEYSGQIKKQITDSQKLAIMKQRVTAALKKKHGIENLNLRITTDSDKSRQAVLNRIAIPKGFVKNHILKSNEKTSKKIREGGCPIILSDNYIKLSRIFFNNRDLDKMTEVNSLYEKNRLIAFMVVYLMNQLGLNLNGKTELSKLGEAKIRFKISDSITADISLSKYPSLVYAVGRKYINKVDSYKFISIDMPILDKIDVIEKERMECVKQILGFEKRLFDMAIIDKKCFTDTETHISFGEICNELNKKGWDKDGLDKLREIRGAALHGEIPDKASFPETELLIKELGKKQK